MSTVTDPPVTNGNGSLEPPVLLYPRGSGLPNASANIGHIAMALAKSQGAFGRVVKDKTAKVRGTSKAGHAVEYSYNFANLASVLDAAIEHLAANGIATLQPVEVSDDRRAVRVQTTLIHGESGEWLQSPGYTMPVNGNDAQALGSATTYARRYDFSSFLSMAQDDDDGAAAKASTQSVPSAEKAPQKLLAKQKTELVEKLIEGGMTAGEAKAAADRTQRHQFEKAMERAQKLVDERAAAAPAAQQDAAAEAGQMVQCPECFGNGDGMEPDSVCTRCDGAGEVAPS